MNTFTERLRAAFDRKGCSRADLAAKLRSSKGTLGISAAAIGEALNGGSKSLSAENAALAARFLGVDVFWLCTGEGSMVPQQEPQPNLSARDAQLLRDIADLPPSKASRFVDQIAQEAADAREAFEHQAARRGVTMAAHSSGTTRTKLEIRVGDGNPNQRPLPLATVTDPWTAQPDDREQALYDRFSRSAR